MYLMNVIDKTIKIIVFTIAMIIYYLHTIIAVMFYLFIISIIKCFTLIYNIILSVFKYIKNISNFKTK